MSAPIATKNLEKRVPNYKKSKGIFKGFCHLLVFCKKTKKSACQIKKKGKGISKGICHLLGKNKKKRVPDYKKRQRFFKGIFYLLDQSSRTVYLERVTRLAVKFAIF